MIIITKCLQGLSPKASRKEQQRIDKFPVGPNSYNVAKLNSKHDLSRAKGLIINIDQTGIMFISARQ